MRDKHYSPHCWYYSMIYDIIRGGAAKVPVGQRRGGDRGGDRSISYYVMLCYVMLYYVVLYHVILCYIIVYYGI